MGDFFPKVQGNPQGVQNCPSNQYNLWCTMCNHHVGPHYGVINQFNGINLDGNLMFN